jgi:hypothetical protein
MKQLSVSSSRRGGKETKMARACGTCHVSRYVPPVLLFACGNCFCRLHPQTRVARLACNYNTVRRAGAQGLTYLRDKIGVGAHSPNPYN